MGKKKTKMYKDKHGLMLESKISFGLSFLSEQKCEGRKRKKKRKEEKRRRREEKEEGQKGMELYEINMVLSMEYYDYSMESLVQT